MMRTGEVIPFPAARRDRYVVKQAEIMLGLAPASAERHLARQIKVQTDAMRRRTISTEHIEREIEALEDAIRAKLFHLVQRGGAG
jgi:hypothetical protein